MRPFLGRQRPLTAIFSQSPATNTGLNAPNKDKAFKAFQNFLEGFFSGIPEKKRKIYLERVETFLKTAFFDFFDSLDSSKQTQLENVSFYLQNAELLHADFASYVKHLDTSTGGRPDLDNTLFRVLHHIIPKFEGGDESAENRVHLHQYEHGLIHLLRYVWKQQRRDLNAFSSACLTEEQLKHRNQIKPTTAAIQARARTVQNPTWQQTVGQSGLSSRQKPVNSPLKRRINAQTGTVTQFKNSRSRVNPFTWYMASITLEFEYKDGTLHTLLPNPDKTKRTVADMVTVLLSVRSSHPAPPKSRYSNFSQVFYPGKNTLFGWKLAAAYFGIYKIPLHENNQIDLLRIPFASLITCLYVQNLSFSMIDLKQQFLQVFQANFPNSQTADAVFDSMVDFISDYKNLYPVGSTNANSTSLNLLKNEARSLF